MIFLWKAAQGTIPKKKPHTLRLAAQASCSQKQIKTSDTERTLMTMITVVWGQITNWSSFKDQARDMRHRSWITVLQHSPAQVLLPRFSSVYSSHPLFSFPVWERDRRIMQVSSLLTAGMATRGSVPSGSSSTGQKEDELLGLHQEAHTAALSRSSVHRAFQSHYHHFTSSMFGWNTGEGFQQNPAGVALSAGASQREHINLQTWSTAILTPWSCSGELANHHLEEARK